MRWRRARRIVAMDRVALELLGADSLRDDETYDAKVVDEVLTEWLQNYDDIVTKRAGMSDVAASALSRRLSSQDCMSIQSGQR